MKPGWRDVDANANEALTRFFNRAGGWEPADNRMPFHELIEREDDGEDGEVGEYELRQRFIGVKAFFRLLKSRGAHPADMLKMLAAAGRACHEAPFHALSMEEAGLLFSETKAAHSWRCKILSREIELTGMRGSKLPGQKGREASASYREARQGNQNRKGRKKAPTARQGSFLRKLKTNQNHHETNHNHD